MANDAVVSVIIPACNEQAVIGRCLDSLLAGAQPGELEIVVVCNGCTDATAETALAFGDRVRVVETAEASKTAALNLGDDVATTFPRIYLDADVRLGSQDCRELASVLREPGALAAAPTTDMVMQGASWPVRAYYRVWFMLPYVREGMIGTGCYALSESGRRRFDRFPDIIADDGYVRMLFSPAERVSVAAARSRVVAPRTLSDLIKIKRRSRLGGYQLRDRFPDLVSRERSEKSYQGILSVLAPRPWVWPHAIAYLWVNLVSRWQAKRQHGELANYVWERDERSRETAE